MPRRERKEGNMVVGRGGGGVYPCLGWLEGKVSAGFICSSFVFGTRCALQVLPCPPFGHGVSLGIGFVLDGRSALFWGWRGVMAN